MDKDKLEKGLEAVLGSMTKSIFEDGMSKQDLLEPFKSEKVLKRAIENSNPEEYYFGLEYDIEKALDAFVESTFGNRDVVFLFRNYQFIESSFVKIIREKEGSCCCADKSRTIVRRLVKFFQTGEEITFDYDQEYTYHLPKTVFKTHEQIVSFYEALKRLKYGNNKDYLLFFANNKELVCL